MRPTIFLINLDIAQERLAFMQEQARRAGINLERVPGVAGAAVAERWRDQFLLPDGCIASPLNAGEVGCYASHLLVCSHIVERDLPLAVVLEDDVEVPEDFGQFIDAVPDLLPPAWDIIKLNNHPSRAVYSLGRVGPRHLVRFYRQPPMTGGYLISNAGARKLLVPRPRNKPIDMEMRQPWNMDLDMFGICPRAVHQLQSMGSYIYQVGGHRLRRGSHFRDPARTFAYAVRTMGLLPTMACRLAEVWQVLVPGPQAPPASGRGAWVPKGRIKPPRRARTDHVGVPTRS